MTLSRAGQSIRDWLADLPARHPSVLPVIAAILIGALVGAGSGDWVARAESGDQIVVGNTGTTLSSVIRVGGSIVVIGGGSTRTGLADLVGRSTVPWNRHVDLLILPGWDDQQSIGALGLLQRGGVRRLVVVGQPGTTAVWTALEQEAARDTIPLDVVSGENDVAISPDVELDLAGDQTGTSETAQFFLASLHYHDSMLSFIDASKDGVKAMSAANASVVRAHLLIAMRPPATLQAREDVLLQPTEASAGDVTPENTSYAGEIRQGAHLVIHLRPEEIRLPLADVKGGQSSNP